MEIKEGEKMNDEIQKQQHKENLDKFSEIFNVLKKLPCKTIVERTKGLNDRVNFLYLVLSGIIIALTTVVVKSFAQ